MFSAHCTPTAVSLSSHQDWFSVKRAIPELWKCGSGVWGQHYTWFSSDLEGCGGQMCTWHQLQSFCKYKFGIWGDGCDIKSIPFFYAMIFHGDFKSLTLFSLIRFHVHSNPLHLQFITVINVEIILTYITAEITPIS